MRICQGKLSHLSLPLLQIKREVLEVGPGTATGGFQLGRVIHSASLFSDLVHFPLFDAVSCFAHGDAEHMVVVLVLDMGWESGRVCPQAFSTENISGDLQAPGGAFTTTWSYSGRRTPCFGPCPMRRNLLGTRAAP